MGNERIKEVIEQGKATLGIEFGSTRIKGVLIDEDKKPIAVGSFDWENHLVNGIWTYPLEEVWMGLGECIKDLKKDVKVQYGVPLKKLKMLGISGMMHGYIPFDKEGNLLTAFRTWRNTMTEKASKDLTELFGYQVPQRWSIAHLYQAVLNGEEHVKKLDYMTTLAGYVHWKLTGEKVLGIGDASGMFPMDMETKDYPENMLRQFDKQVEAYQFDWKIKDVLPKVYVAGEMAGTLTEEGAKLLDPEGDIQAGVLLCPPEGDAQTGMTATNSVRKRTGNISAGTSVFAMVVLEKALKKVHEELDLVTTPSGDLVAMVHCNNCTSDINAWAGLLKEFVEKIGMKIDNNTLYTILFEEALKGEKDGGGLLSYCYLSGEHITGFEEGRPLFVRKPGARLSLANFMRTQLMTTMGAIRMGMDILTKEEQVVVDEIRGHGGFFKTPRVGQEILSGAIGVPVSVMETAGEGGAWGIALLASYCKESDFHDFADFLEEKVFAHQLGTRVEPKKEDVAGFHQFYEAYVKGLAIERTAIEQFS